MALAGGSSVLIAGDALRLWGDTVDDEDPGIPGLPKAVKIYKEDKNVERRKRVDLSKAPILRACGMMETWRKANPYKRTARRDWYYYQLNGLQKVDLHAPLSHISFYEAFAYAEFRGLRLPTEPEGSFYCFADLSDLPPPLNDGMAFFRKALEHKVICVPGVFFDVDPGRRRSHIPSRLRRFVRLSFGPDMETMT